MYPIIWGSVSFMESMGFCGHGQATLLRGKFESKDMVWKTPSNHFYPILLDLRLLQDAKELPYVHSASVILTGDSSIQDYVSWKVTMLRCLVLWGIYVSDM